ncbi:MAG: helicase-related protein [Candidatus Nanoarchaeia archaeon]
MAYFITNLKEKNLKERLMDLIRISSELKFLVGFFYFSGLKEFYEILKELYNKNELPDEFLKILVGLNVSETLYGIIEVGEPSRNYSNQDLQNQYFLSIKNSLEAETFDTKEFYEQANFFIELIKKNKIIIRKTYKPNHSKLYFFKLKDQTLRESVFITGSSNLTKSGLINQNEFNVEISDFGTKEAEEYFDTLWKEAVRITEDDNIKQKLINFLNNETLLREITPYEAYAYVLKTYLDTYKGKDISERILDIFQENGYTPYEYQLDAIKQALSIIEKHNGVIIADVVGLGKTIIACAVAFELKKRGIVIAPPGLVGDEFENSGWQGYLEKFSLKKLGWQAYSLGKLKEIKDKISKTKDIEVVIIDEAHRFRNQDTESYEDLINICRGKIVILLTATPFNNTPSDIFSLLKLFIIPKKSTITISDNLEYKFKKFKNTFYKLFYIKRYINSNDNSKKEKVLNYYKTLFGKTNVDLKKVEKRANLLAKEIKSVIEPVIIRRNRLDLQKNPNYEKEINQLSIVDNPKEWFFELTTEQLNFYERVITKYFALPEEGGEFKGAIYIPFLYKFGIQEFKKLLDKNSYDISEILEEEIKDQDLKKLEAIFQYYQQFNLYDFMRKLFVKRFESSFGAFKQSIENFIKTLENVLKFIDKSQKYILDRNLIKKIYEKTEDEIKEELNKYKKEISENKYPEYHEVYELDQFKNKDEFLSDIKKDKELFEGILKELEQLKLTENDPKAKKLVEELKESLENEPKRKIVIFSEYIDTIKHLEKILEENKFKVLVVADNLTQSKIKEIIENFDASYPEDNQKNDYDILLATDRISEGFNLNRAGMVINYDIPWNPVRVIQRVGRINRISKKVFDKLYIVNFFPTEKGSDYVKSREIAASKMFLIHKALGEDSKIFDISEEPTPSGLYGKIQKNPDYLEEESFYTKVLKEYEEIKNKIPNIEERLSQFPSKIKIARKREKNQIFVIIKKIGIHVYYKDLTKENSEVETKNLEEVLDQLKSISIEEKSISVSNTFWNEYENIKKHSEEKISYSENSLEQRSINILKTLLNSNKKEIENYKKFIEMLLEDILYYGTLPYYTLRKITNLKINKTEYLLKELEELKNSLGENYLNKEKIKAIKKEIIIAIEDRYE